MALGSSLVKKVLKASGTQIVSTAYYPSSTGMDMSLVPLWNALTLFYTNAGHGSSTVDLTVQYSNDAGVTWFDGPPTYGLDIFAQTTTVAVVLARRLAVNCQRFRVKAVVAVATSGAFAIDAEYDGGNGVSLV